MNLWLHHVGEHKCAKENKSMGKGLNLRVKLFLIENDKDIVAVWGYLGFSLKPSSGGGEGFQTQHTDTYQVNQLVAAV